MCLVGTTEDITAASLVIFLTFFMMYAILQLLLFICSPLQQFIFRHSRTGGEVVLEMDSKEDDVN